MELDSTKAAKLEVRYADEWIYREIRSSGAQVIDWLLYYSPKEESLAFDMVIKARREFHF